MSSIYHSNVKTTASVRKEIQSFAEIISALARGYGVNAKAVMKWRHAGRVEDKRSGAKKPRSALTEAEQQTACEFRRLTKFGLDDVLVALKPKILALTRSNNRGCLTQFVISI